MASHDAGALAAALRRRLARVQPGLVLDELRNEAEKQGLSFGTVPATHKRCALGGMLGSNSCGVHSVMAGRTSEAVAAAVYLHRLCRVERS
jgi:FAD/FMN-containing dehydrogenase